MIKIKKFRLLLLIGFCALAACSSEKAPIAEVFLGKWEIFQKNENNAGLVTVSGEMSIDFGNEIITFDLTVDDETAPVSLNGIVHNEYLYQDSSRQTRLGSLELTKSGTLNITIYGEDEEKVIYYGIK